MIEEFLTRRIEKLQEQNAKIQDDAEKSFDEIDEKKDKYVTVSSSYTYQESEDALNTQERFHYATFLTVAIAAQAVESKLLKTKYARRMVRRFLLSDTGKYIRSLLYRKGSAGTSQGLLRSSTPGSPGLVKSILRHRMQKDQIRSTGISIKQAGMAADDFVSEGLEKLISMSLFIEENSPMKMMRTMSASQILQSIKMRKDMPSYHISGQDMTEMGTYYHQMIDKYGKGRSINQYDSNLGLFYDNGRILGAKMENGKVVANQADVLAHGVIPAFTQTDVSGNGLDVNTNQIFRKYLVEQGVSTAVLDSYNNLPGTKKVSFVFGNNTADAAKNYAAGYMSKMFESGSRAMDSPFAAIVEPIEEKIRATKDPKSKKLFQTLYNTFTPRFGSGTLSANADKLLYDRSLKEQAKSLLKNVIAKPIGIAAGVLTANQLIGSTFGDEYRLEQLGGDLIANTQLLYAKIFSDGFLQDIKQKQEEIMPNSTGFQPILGVVGSLGMMGATASYFKGLHEKSTIGLAGAEVKSAAAKLNIDPLVNILDKHIGPGAGQVANNILDKAKTLPFVGEFLSKDHHRSTRWAIAGAAIGAALSLPLLPGAIAGETSEELQKQFSGEKKVAVKANSGWIFGGEDYEGGKIKYFDRHWYAKLKANVSTKVYYGDESTKDELNPVINPFGYLADPYKLEKMHEKDMPYPVWGMDVTYGGFIGEVFEGTVGRIIKPTIVNENLKQYLASDNQEGEFKLKKKVTQEEAALIQEGKLLLPIAPENSPTADAAKKAAIGALDFSGFKGFMLQTVVSKAGYTDPLLTNSSLERSGSMVTLAKSIKESNMGDMMGLGEAQRRIVNTGADSLAGRKENPLRNLMPSWMPGDESEYYIDFQHGNPFCLSPDSEVITSDGLLRIRDVNENTLIYTEKGRFLNVSKKFTREYNEDGYKIKFSGISSEHSAIFSKEHPILIKKSKKCSFGSSSICRPDVRNYNGFCSTKNCTNKWEMDDVAYIEAKDVKVGDIAVFPLAVRENTTDIIEYKYIWRDAPRSKDYNISGVLSVNEDIAWLLGLYISEGSTGKVRGKPQRLIFSLHSKEIDIMEKAEEILIKYFSCKRITRVIRENSTDLIVTNSRVARIFNSIIPGNLYQKRIPEHFFDFSNSVCASLIMGILVGDANVKSNEIVLEMANKKLIEDIYILSSIIGIPAGIRSSDRGGKLSYIYSIHPFNLRNIDTSRLLYKEKIIIKNPERQPSVKVWTDGKFIYSLVVDIERLFIEEVIGLEIDHDDTFAVPGAMTHNSKVENAEARLPGVGYAEFNPTLKGMDTEKYPLINRYEILSDVALGSKEYYNTKRELENKQKRGELTQYESDKISRIEEETTARMKTKNFSDDTTVDTSNSKIGILGNIAKTYWKGLSYIAQGPHETLTPVRFGSKFIHDRTATEDYKKNMIFGNDMALWTRPVDHFLAASAHETLGALEDETSIPESVDRQRAIDQYFDRLEFYKQRQLYKKARSDGDTSTQRKIKAKMESTKVGAEATKLNSKQDLFAAYRSMSSREKEYFQNFAQTTDPEKQEEILGMVSQDEAKIYRTIWENNERMEQIDSEEEMAAFITDDTKEYEKNMDKAEAESVEFMSSTLGMPDVDFSGWDPRIEIKDIKLRFLQLAREEVRDYGYWANDELEMLRKVAILRDNNFMDKRDDIDILTAKYRNREESEFNIRQHLQKQNIKVKNVEVRDGNGSFDIIQQD